MQQVATAPSGYATSVTLITGLAWPLFACVATYYFRSELKTLLKVLEERLSSAKSFKLGPVEVGEIFDKAAQKTKETLGNSEAIRDVPEVQVESSKELAEELKSNKVPREERLAFAELRLTKLALDYDLLRQKLDPGPARTMRMDEIVSLMRTFALPAIPLLGMLMTSDSPGERLAAIAILQVKSFSKYINWLRNRFVEEDQAFILFHTALVLRRMSRIPRFAQNTNLEEAISFGLQKVKSFKGGEPDQSTIEVLSDAYESYTHR
ncbi:MAG: hypothetical protein V4734_00980 [Terriglobus sp.]